MLVLEWKEITFIEKVNSRCFCWFPAAILVYQNGAPIWRLYTKLYKDAWNVSANNSETVGHKDLKRGQIVYILVFYNISFSWLLPLDGFQLNFLLRDSENDLLSGNILKSSWRICQHSQRYYGSRVLTAMFFKIYFFPIKKRFISIFHVLNYSINPISSIFSQIYYRLFIEWFEKKKTRILKNDQMADAWFNILQC